MLHFSIPGTILIVFMAVMTCMVVNILLKRIQQYTLKEGDDYLKKFGVLLTVLGGLSLALSIGLCILVYNDFQGNSKLLNPFHVLVSEPARLFIAALFFLGIIAFIVGLFTAKQFSGSKKPPGSEGVK